MVKKATRTRKSSPSTRRRGKGWKAGEVLALLEPQYGPFVWRRRWDPVTELMFTILSQHTSDINAERAERMLEERFESWEETAEADVSEIEAAIQVSGLARQKAPRIQGTLRRILELRGELSLDFLSELPLSEAKAWMQALPGVGPKTAAVVLCFALGMPAMAVDTHVHRVSRRLRLIGPKVTAEKAHDLLEGQVSPEEVFAFHVALITHGRRVCKALRPRCGECVLSERCPSRQG